MSSSTRSGLWLGIVLNVKYTSTLSSKLVNGLYSLPWHLPNSCEYQARKHACPGVAQESPSGGVKETVAEGASATDAGAPEKRKKPPSSLVPRPRLVVSSVISSQGKSSHRWLLYPKTFLRHKKCWFGPKKNRYGIRRWTSHPPGPISMVDTSTVGIVLIVSVPKRSAMEHLAESFPKTYRSVLAPSWLSSNRAWKTAPGGVDIQSRIR